MNLFRLSALITIITNFGITFFLAWKGRKSILIRLFAGFTLSAGIWGLGAFMLAGIPEIHYASALFWWQFAYIGVISAPLLFSHFILQLLNAKNHKPLLLFAYMFWAIFVFFNWYDNSRLFLGEISFVYNQFYWIDWIKSKNIIWLFFYISFWWFLLGYSFFLLLKAYKRSTGILRNQLKYCIVGSIIGWIGGEVMFFTAFRLYFYPYLNFLVAFYTFIFAYTIIRYRLMDVKVAITRASVFIVVYTFVLGLPFALAGWHKPVLIMVFGAYWWTAPLGLMAALATFGPFIYIYIDRRAEERLLKEQRHYQNILKQASAGMTRIRSLQKLLNMIVHIVTKTVRITYAAVYLYDKQVDECVLQVSRDRGRASLLRINVENPLIKWLAQKKEPLIYEEVKRCMEDTGSPAYKELEENMRLLTASVIIPSFLNEKFMGFFVMGDKLSRQIYTVEDLSVFQVLAGQAALAIENAQFYEEAKEMSQQIAQAEKMATIGTMADGLSHQINNRFYALSLIAGDSIDTIKMTDTRKCTPEVKEMIKQVNYALSRIQANVVQGGEVVKGLLKYSRKGDVGFEAVDLSQVIDETLEMVQYKVKLSEIDLIREFPKRLPKIKANMAQMQEVFFNFIDNAYDSIVERRTILKEEGYRGKITVSAKTKGSNLEIVVEDNGMGVKDANNKKLFTPFFTTKVSARKGTGLGLYVIKRIITETHKGKISFESKHKAGARFVIELPLFK